MTVTAHTQENQSLKAHHFVSIMLGLNTQQRDSVIICCAKHDPLSEILICGFLVGDIIAYFLNLKNIRQFLSHTRVALFGIIASLAAAFDIEFDP